MASRQPLRFNLRNACVLHTLRDVVIFCSPFLFHIPSWFAVSPSCRQYVGVPLISPSSKQKRPMQDTRAAAVLPQCRLPFPPPPPPFPPFLHALLPPSDVTFHPSSPRPRNTAATAPPTCRLHAAGRNHEASWIAYCVAEQSDSSCVAFHPTLWELPNFSPSHCVSPSGFSLPFLAPRSPT